MANVLIYSSNSIGKSMAGPAIRSWEFAKALSKHHQVSLICPNSPEVEEQTFKIICKRDLKRKEAFRNADVLITQSITPLQALRAKHNNLTIIIDAYDPLPLECLEQFKEENIKIRQQRQFSSINHLIFSFKMADGILCASEKQRDLWMGFLLGKNLLTPSKYDLDNSLRNLIDVVPFGLSSEKPEKNDSGLKEKYQFGPDDKILLWGGGIWNWFDPLTLIKAMKLLQPTHPEIKLVFMGMKTPEPSVPEMEMGKKAIDLASELELINRTIFFNTGWVPYHQRQNNLLDATLGISTHFDHLETRYSFRTRMLDYIWAELPILATQGDSFAELIKERNLGLVVPYKDERVIAESIKKFINNKKSQEEIKENLKKVQPLFYWDNVVKPIVRMIQFHSSKPKKNFQLNDYGIITNFILNQIRAKGLKGLMEYCRKPFRQ